MSLLFIQVSNAQTLKSASAACGLNMGTAIADAPLQNETAYRNMIIQEYGMVVPENAMKMGVIKTTETGAYDYAAADRLITFAQQNGMKVRGHTILWHSQIPAWVLNKTWTKATLLAYLKDYITNVAGHFKGKIAEWDVANEFINDDNANALRNSIWISVIGEQVLDSAYKWVHQVDPAATLIYNDYGAETMNSKSTAVFNLVSRLKNRGVPINGVGLQTHKSYNEALTMNDPLITQMDQNIKRIGALGLQVSITELDLKLPLPVNAATYADQATSYGNILRVAIANPTIVKSFVTWGFTGKYSWITCLNGLFGDALPFDALYAKKPAYNELLSVLQNNCGSTGNTPPTVSISIPVNNTTVCAGTSITLTSIASDANGTISKVEFYDGTTLLSSVTSSPYTYNWTNAGNGAHSITAKATDNGNAVTTSTAVSITVNVAPAAPTVSSPVTFCQNSTATALTATGTTLTWYTVASGGTGSSTAPIPVTTATGTTNYYVSQTTGGCESARTLIAVNISAAPSAPTVTPITYCQNTSATALSATGNALKWYTVGTGGTGSATAPTPSTLAAGTINYYVTQTISGCTSESSRAMLAVTVNALPSAPTVTTPVTYCQNSTATILTATGTALKWYTAANGGTSSSTAPTPVTTATGTTNYYVSQTTNGCESARANITVTISASPSSPTVTTPVTYCQNDATTALSATGTALKWYTVTTGGIGSANAPTPSTTAAGTTNYYVSQTANGCTNESARALITVTVNALPSANITAGGPTTFTQGGSVLLSANTGSGLIYNWLNGTTAVGAASSYNATATGNYTVVVTNASGCISISTPITITVNGNQPPTVNITSPANNASFTAPSNVTITANASDADGTVTGVDFYNGTTLIGSDASSPYTFIWNNLSAGTYNIIAKATDNNGGIGTSSTITITISGNQPSVINVTSTTNSNGTGTSVTINVTATDPDGGIVLVEYLDGTTVIGTSTTQPYGYILDNPSPGTHVISVRVTDSNGGITTSTPSNITVGATGLFSGNDVSGNLYPNPVHSLLHIETQITLSGAMIRFIDAFGTDVIIPITVNDKNADADVSLLAPGAYTLLISREGTIIRKKFVVMHR